MLVLKFEKNMEHPKIGNGFVQLIRMGKSTRLKVSVFIVGLSSMNGNQNQNKIDFALQNKGKLRL